ncbi:MAG TPA: hypothetical protein VH561_00510 [Micromonosporaceae bacterium]
MSEPVQSYLDELFDRLAGTGAAGRRALVEAEDHLASAVARHRAAGHGDEEAQRMAVAEFGDPARFAEGIARAHDGLGSLLRPLFTGAWLLAGIGLVAVGVSGLVAELFGHLGGAHFVAGDLPGVTYTPQRCADYFEYFPNAASCAEAAELHHWGEVVDNRVAAGVLGLLALGVYALVRRVGPLTGARWRPAGGPFALVTVTLFGLAAVLLTVPDALRWAMHDSSGVGANLSGGIVAALVSAGVGLVALRRRARQHARTQR